LTEFASAPRRLFGTDGVRGEVNREPVTAETALALGRALTLWLRRERAPRRAPKIVVGKDTRLSGDMLESAVIAGILSQGGDALRAGVLPTPALAGLTASERADAGVVISASHNPFADNGLKIFDSEGYKLPDATEARLEALMNDSALLLRERPSSRDVGRARPVRDALGRYVAALKKGFPPDMTLEGLSVVLDCAHGAAHECAPMALRELGAQVEVLGAEPDGFNINHGVGSLHPEVCAAKVRETGASVGIALDGDADRAILIDGRGRVVDGDQIMFLCALHFHRRGILKNNAIAATVMSNMALELALNKEGIRVFRVQVGDRYVAAKLREENLNFGGEKSGHLIFLDHATTGDGALAALQILAIMRQTGLPLEELAALMVPFPQVLINVRVPQPRLALEDARVTELVERCRERLGEKGRIILRPSGTEPVVRVMVEGEDEREITRLAKECAAKVAEILA
jgi:phosphoglucosamine mutase